MSDRPVVIVTGSARRLGRTIAMHLGRQGWDIAVHHRGAADEADEVLDALRRAGAQAHAFRADLADEAAARRLLPAVAERFGRVDAVVHNASIFEHDDATTFRYDTLERHVRVNTAPALVLAQALHAHLLARGARGCQVHLLDQKLWNPNPDHLSYTLSKAALESATTLLAQALAPVLRVCGVAPGVTLPSGPMNQAEFDQAHRMTPLERSSTPDDIAAAVSYLLQARAVTGTTLLVDGGQHLAAQPRDVYFLSGGPGR